MDLNTRLVKLMQYYDYSPSIFADEVGIIRSSISHIVSGRNKPGVDLLQKVLKRFPEISTDWLLMGVGAMFKDVNKSPKSDGIPDSQSEIKARKSEILSQDEKSKPAVASVQMNLLDYVGDPDPKPEKPMEDDSTETFPKDDPVNQVRGKNNNSESAAGAEIKRITVYFADGTYSDFIRQ